jgi:hypothetical protein
LAAQSRKLGAGERSGGCQATLRKSRGARAIIARVILPRVRERKAIRSAKLNTASLREERGIGREGGSKISNGGGRASERAGDSQLSPTPETFASGATFQSYSGREFCEFFGERMRSLCLCAHVVLRLALLTRYERWISSEAESRLEALRTRAYFLLFQRQQSTWHFNWNCAVGLNLLVNIHAESAVVAWLPCKLVKVTMRLFSIYLNVCDDEAFS